MPSNFDVVLIIIVLGLLCLAGRRWQKDESVSKRFEPKIKKLETELYVLLGTSDSRVEDVVLVWVSDLEHNRHLVGATASDALERLKDARRYAGLNDAKSASTMLDIANRELESLRVQLECLAPQK